MKTAEAIQRKFSKTSTHVRVLGSEGDKIVGLEDASSSRSSPLEAYPWLCLCLIYPPPATGVPPDIFTVDTNQEKAKFSFLLQFSSIFNSLKKIQKSVNLPHSGLMYQRMREVRVSVSAKKI